MSSNKSIRTFFCTNGPTNTGWLSAAVPRVWILARITHSDTVINYTFHAQSYEGLFREGSKLLKDKRPSTSRKRLQTASVRQEKKNRIDKMKWNFILRSVFIYLTGKNLLHI